MEDLAGFGRAVEKFLDLLGSSIGTLYKPRAIRNQGRAQADVEAYRAIAASRADTEAKLVALESDERLAVRAATRLRHQEMEKQTNIESIIERTIPKIEDKQIADDVDKDWLSHFFENCANVSNVEIQELWSKTLAAKITDQYQLPKKVIDCLRWLDPRLAKQFLELATRIFIFHGFFANDVALRKKIFSSVSYPFDAQALEEIGLIKENVDRSFYFRCCSLRVRCQELSDRSIQFRRFYEFTPSGRWLAQNVIPNIARYFEYISSHESDEMKRFNVYHWDSYDKRRDAAESLILSTSEKKSLAVGQIIHYLIEKEVSVSIEKGILVKRGRYSYATSADVMRLRNKRSKGTIITKPSRGRHLGALSRWEREFLDELEACVKANQQVLTRK